MNRTTDAALLFTDMITVDRLLQRLYRILLITFLCTAGPALVAQDVILTATADSSQLTIGNWMTLRLEAQRVPSSTLHWPQFADTLGAFSIVKVDSTQAADEGSSIVERRILTLTAFDAGTFQIPSIGLPYTQLNDSAIRRAYSAPILVAVSSVEVDSAKGLRDIKPPVSIPLTWKEILLYLGIVLLIAAVVYAFIRYRRKKKAVEEDIADVKPRIPAHVTALIKFKELEERRIWQQGNVKGFYSEATDILREYFEGRYGVMALEMTTDETMDQLRRRIEAPDALHRTSSLLVLADLVKFAKYITTPQENESVIPRALEIVEMTKQIEVVTDNA